MSIQSEINRISGNVSSALAAIAEKGVSVPAGSKSDALSSLIRSIASGGGGLPAGISALDCGSFTPASDSSNPYSVTCSFEETPNFLVVVRDDNGTGAVSGMMVAQIALAMPVATANGVYSFVYTMLRYNTSGLIAGSGSTVVGTAKSENYFKPGAAVINANPSAKFHGGYTYHWICGVLDGIV